MSLVLKVLNIQNEITDDEYKKLNDTEKKKYDNERTLEACYENYFKTDTSRDEKFECEVCEKESPAIALRLIHTVPDVALISLLRVQEDRSGGSYRTFKNKNSITYPKSISLTSNPDEQYNLKFVGNHIGRSLLRYVRPGSKMFDSLSKISLRQKTIIGF